MADKLFDTLILIGRPASGKSEIIDYLLKMPVDERRRRYSIGELTFIDDFPMLWTWFEEDHILAEELGQPRLHTDEEGYFLYEDQWHLLIRRIDLEYRKWRRDNPQRIGSSTTIVEFARGSEHGGYAAAVPHLSSELLSRAAILYVNVSYAESLRKNRARFNPERPDSILEHGLPDEKLTRLYRDDDWSAFSAGNPHYVTIGGAKVPYSVFENEDDVTSGSQEELGARLDQALERLRRTYFAQLNPGGATSDR